MLLSETQIRSKAGRMSMKRVAIAAGLVLALSACTADYAKQSTAPVLFGIAAINGGAVLASDVSLVVPDVAPVSMYLRNTNRNDGVPVPNLVQAVIVERYEIRYYRSDGRSTEGVDVPYRISGNLTTALDVASSGTVDVPLEVVRAQAKLEPPLRNLRAVDTEFGGSALILTCFAEVTVHGKTLAGQAVTASGRLQIDFADWP
jgi:hypothetical protein